MEMYTQSYCRFPTKFYMVAMTSGHCYLPILLHLRIMNMIIDQITLGDADWLRCHLLLV